MTALHYIILSGLIISALSISGVALIKSSKKIARFVERNLMILSAASAGVFLVTSSLLIHETLKLLPLHGALGAFAIGIAAYFILHRVFNHHRHGEGKDHDHSHDHENKQAAWKVLVGDTIHNIADGLLLVSSFGFGTSIGITNALSIALHEIPQEISEFMVLRKSGYSNTEAAFRNFATALSIFVGIGIGLALINTEAIQAYLLGATATFFLGIVFTDLFPLKTILKGKNILQMFSALILGALFMIAVSQSLGHSHGHEGSHDHDHNHIHEYEDLHDHDINEEELPGGEVHQGAEEHHDHSH